MNRLPGASGPFAGNRGADRCIGAQVNALSFEPFPFLPLSKSVQRRYGAGLDAAKAIAHNEVVATARFVDEIWHLAEIVAVIGVTHDDVFAARGGDARF